MAIWRIRTIWWTAVFAAIVAAGPTVADDLPGGSVVPLNPARYILDSSSKTTKIPTFRTTDELSFSYAQRNAVFAPDSVARGLFDYGEDVFLAAYTHPLRPDLTLKAEDSLRFPRQEIIGTEAMGQGDVSVNNFTLRTPYEGFEKLTLEPFYSNESWHYQDRSVSSAMDYTVSSVGFGASYQLFKRTKIRTDARVEQIQYEDRLRDADAQIAVAGVEQKLTNKLTAAGEVGVEQRESAAGPTQGQPRADVNVSYAFMPDTTLTIGHRYAIAETYNTDYLNETTRTYYSKLSQKVMRNLRVETGAAYERDDQNFNKRQLNEVIPEEYWRFDLAPSYRLSDELSAQLGYSVKYFENSSLQKTPFDNSVFLSLRFNY